MKFIADLHTYTLASDENVEYAKIKGLTGLPASFGVVPCVVLYTVNTLAADNSTIHNKSILPK
jgi:sulfite exporter TauE/SafE